jgi:hypothetical protein
MTYFSELFPLASPGPIYEFCVNHLILAYTLLFFLLAGIGNLLLSVLRESLQQIARLGLVARLGPLRHAGRRRAASHRRLMPASLIRSLSSPPMEAPSTAAAPAVSTRQQAP